MADADVTKILNGLVLQEDGTILNYHDEIIARLVDGVNFDSGKIAPNIVRFSPIIDTCDQGHNYAKLPDHPVNNEGRPRCPICMAKGLDDARKELDDLKDDLRHSSMERDLYS